MVRDIGNGRIAMERSLGVGAGSLDETRWGLPKPHLRQIVGRVFNTLLLFGLFTNTYLLFRLLGATEQLVGVLALKMEITHDDNRQGHESHVEAEGLPGATPR